jgi:hypothetical protein
MKSEVKKRWVDALRSGKYRQGTGYLINSSNATGQCKHCCLGVLCDLYLQEHDATLSWNSEAISDTEVLNVASLYGTEFLLPYQVQQWAGLHESSPCVEYLDSTEMLSELNDYHGLDFDYLADLIEDSL